MAASKPTAPLSLAVDTLPPFTLIQRLGALTAVWVVPLSETDLTPAPRLPRSTRQQPSELDKGLIPFGTHIPNL